MADRSKIEWTDATWNPIRGCSRVSEGCRNCYAERIAARFSGIGQPYEGLALFHDLKSDLGLQSHWTGDVRFIPELLEQPLRWRRPRKIFVNSISDLFHEKVPIEWIVRIFNVMASETPGCGKRHKHEDECWTGAPHTFQILTKRPQRMLDILKTELPDYVAGYMAGDSPLSLAFDTDDWPLPNVWLGVSVEDQKTADERIPLLLQTPAAVRWVSYEPALGPIDFVHIQHDGVVEIDSLTGDHGVYRPLTGRAPGNKLHWVVAGGESGPGARPANPDWFRSARDQCMEASVPFFFKQWGEWLNGSQLRPTYSDAELDRITFKTACKETFGAAPKTDGSDLYFRVGKKRAGHLLDGIPWREFPKTNGTMP